jgi:hypothetical protein
MSEWKVKRGNTSEQEIPVYDRNDILVQDLAAASEVKFVVKKNETTTVGEIVKAVGSGITINSPETGYLKIILDPDDTNIDIRTYYMGLQIIWASKAYEVRIYIDDVETERFVIEQDIVNVES